MKLGPNDLLKVKMKTVVEQVLQVFPKCNSGSPRSVGSDSTY